MYLSLLAPENMRRGNPSVASVCVSVLFGLQPLKRFYLETSFFWRAGTSLDYL